MKACLQPGETHIRQLAQQQCSELQILLSTTSLQKDEELSSRMLSTSTLVVDSLAEGFKRPGHLVFLKNFLVVAKSFNSEYGGQLAMCLQKHLTTHVGNKVMALNRTLGETIAASVKTLQEPARSNDVAGATTLVHNVD